MKTCYIFGAGEYGDRFPIFRKGDLVIAADGGYRVLMSRGIQPHVVMGDFDSLGWVPDHPYVKKYSPQKDDTDLALAVEEGWSQGYTRFCIYGALGGRLDHTLANLQLLCGIACRGGHGYLVGRDTMVAALCDGTLEFSALYQGTVSVFCHGQPARGVTLEGLKYPLQGATLTPNVPQGVSNEFTGERARITVEQGVLLVMWEEQGRDEPVYQELHQ